MEHILEYLLRNSTINSEAQLFGLSIEQEMNLSSNDEHARLIEQIDDRSIYV